MIVKYLTNTTFRGLSSTYKYDDNVNFKNLQIFADGRLSINVSPVFQDLSDFKRNNYSLLYLTNRINLPEITDFYTPALDNTINIGKIFVKHQNATKYLKFDAAIDDQEFLAINYDQSFDNVGDNEPLNIFHFIKKTDTTCNIMYRYANNDYFLNFNPVTINLNFTVLSAFNDLKEYTRNFYFAQDINTGAFTLQCRIQGTAYRVVYNSQTNRLALSTINDISRTDTRCIFYLTGYNAVLPPEITVDWGSYQKKFNQNDLTINSSRSFFDTKNNFLLHSEYLTLNTDFLAHNLLTLKTQLNSKNLSTRGNCFFDEDSVSNRDYVTIFSGGRQEQGHDKLQLQYETYTYPYTFSPGKATWFHTPQTMWPFERLNINHTSLVDAGAVGGDHPLRSDKVFKKLGNYKNTSNFGNSVGEHTGQWLCSWLSAAPDITVKPVWVDRFYNPTVLTPFQALSATPGALTYIPSYTAYLKEGIYDKPSSLTFEPGNLYVYNRIGKVDAIENINSLNPYLQSKNFTTYVNLENKNLQPEQRLNLTDYTFNGKNYATLDVTSFATTINMFTISFWASRDDWTIPCGFQLGGNFTDYGIGFFNYESVNPLLMYVVSNSAINAYNSNLDLINVYDLANISNSNIISFCRRDPLNSFHVFTDASSVYELNLQEAIIDAAPLSRIPTSVINDGKYAYITLNNTAQITKFDLLTNTYVLCSAIYLNTLVPNSVPYNNNRTVIPFNNQIYALSTYNNTPTRLIKSNIYFLSCTNIDDSGGFLCVWDLLNNTNVFTYPVSTVIDFPYEWSKTRKYQTFNIDKNNDIWCVSGTNIDVYGQYGILKKTLTLSSLLCGYNSSFKIQNITFADNFINGSLEESIYISASGTKNIFVSKIDKSGKVEKTISMQSSSFINVDPSNYNYNLTYTTGTQNKYTFKARLFNQLNTEDSTILELPVINSDLNPGFHHFTVTVDTLKGQASLYLDGTLYTQRQFEPGTYTFTSTIYDNLIIGATPFYNNTLLHTFLSRDKNTNYYMVNDLVIENFYWFNKILDYFDVGMLYKEKIEPSILTWDIPAGRRYFNETISRYFVNKVPGAKSGLVNIYIKSDTLDKQCRDALEPEIINKLTSLLPAHVMLNKLIWTTSPVLPADVTLQPSYAGNTVTNAGVSR